MKNTRIPENVHPTLRILTISLLIIILIFLAIFLFSRNSPTEQNVPTTSPSPIATVTTPTLPPTHTAKRADPHLVWFTTIPRTEDLFTVAQRFDLYILIQGNEAERDLMINLGAKGPFLQYLSFGTIQDPGSCTDHPELNQVTSKAGDFCMIDQQHPSWFLLDANGKRISTTDKDNTWYLMDPGNLEWRAFYLDRIKEFQVGDANWAGVFLDNVPLTLATHEADGHFIPLYPDDTSYQTAVQGFLKYLYEGYFHTNSKLLFGNLSSRKDDSDWTRHLAYLDGAMLEGWAIDWPNGYRPVERWEQHMLLAEQTQDLGKTILLVSRGKREDFALQQFSFASYLLINDEQAFFRYAEGSKYREVWLYDNYSYNLGNPIGPRYKDGDVWRRDFTNGAVMVNPKTHEVEISLK